MTVTYNEFLVLNPLKNSRLLNLSTSVKTLYTLRHPDSIARQHGLRSLSQSRYLSSCQLLLHVLLSSIFMGKENSEKAADPGKRRRTMNVTNHIVWSTILWWVVSIRCLFGQYVRQSCSKKWFQTYPWHLRLFFLQNSISKHTVWKEYLQQILLIPFNDLTSNTIYLPPDIQPVSTMKNSL